MRAAAKVKNEYIARHTCVYLGSGGESTSFSAAGNPDDPNETVFFSAVSSLEIAIKWAKGNLELPDRPYEFVNKTLAAAGISQLAITVRDTCAVGDLPHHHHDPFDRLLVAQARTNGMRLMTADPILERYDVDVIALWLNDDE
ncbi:MAG: type II toxin-antitoxin system VapC family toxin [Chloracidobacterium sp.]|nr:type II toxin-antitoxin system VapC family toxin [Chloracidobacterium sp.]